MAEVGNRLDFDGEWTSFDNCHALCPRPSLRSGRATLGCVVVSFATVVGSRFTMIGREFSVRDYDPNTGKSYFQKRRRRYDETASVDHARRARCACRDPTV